MRRAGRATPPRPRRHPPRRLPPRPHRTSPRRSPCSSTSPSRRRRSCTPRTGRWRRPSPCSSSPSTWVAPRSRASPTTASSSVPRCTSGRATRSRIHLRNTLDEPTNLHSHGVFVSPIGISDNVLRIMQPDSNNDFVLELPADLDPGTYWYHSHLHGRTEAQVFAGLAGRLRRRRAAGAAARRAARHPRPRPGPEGPPGQGRRHRHREHRLQRADHPHRQRPGRPGAHRAHQRRPRCSGWPTSAPTSGTGSSSTAPQFHVIAEDANPVAEVWTADELVLPPGKRFDVLVRWPQAGHPPAADPGVQQRARGRQLPRAHARHVHGRAATRCPTWRGRRRWRRRSELIGAKVDRTARVRVQREHEDQPVLHQRPAVRHRPRSTWRAKLGTIEEWTHQERLRRGAPVPHPRQRLPGHVGQRQALRAHERAGHRGATAQGRGR